MKTHDAKYLGSATATPSLKRETDLKPPEKFDAVKPNATVVSEELFEKLQDYLQELRQVTIVKTKLITTVA